MKLFDQYKNNSSRPSEHEEIYYQAAVQHQVYFNISFYMLASVLSTFRVIHYMILDDILWSRVPVQLPICRTEMWCEVWWYQQAAPRPFVGGGTVLSTLQCPASYLPDKMMFTMWYCAVHSLFTSRQDWGHCRAADWPGSCLTSLTSLSDWNVGFCTAKSGVPSIISHYCPCKFSCNQPDAHHSVTQSGLLL